MTPEQEMSSAKVVTSSVLLCVLLAAFAVGSALAQEDRWESRGLIGKTIRALDVSDSNPQILYAGVQDQVYKSSSGGNSWSHLDATGYGWTNCLTIDPQNSDIVYRSSGYIWRTADGGPSWTQWSEPPTDAITDLVICPLNSSLMYAAYGPWFLKSQDAGITWKAVRTSLNIRDLALELRRPGVVYAATSYKGLCVSADEGWNWEKVNPMGLWHIEVCPSNPSVLYGCVGYGSMYKSEDSGSSWVKMTEAGLGSLSIEVIAASSPDPSTTVIYIGTSDGVFSITESIDTAVSPTSWGHIKALFHIEKLGPRNDDLAR